MKYDLYGQDHKNMMESLELGLPPHSFILFAFDLLRKISVSNPIFRTSV